MLAVAVVFLYSAKHRGRKFFDVARSETTGWNATHLVLASLLTLFAELAFIRWVAVEVRIFAYCKNLALLLCFVGFGIGCALVAEKDRWPSALKAFIGLVVVLRLPWQHATPLEDLSRALGGVSDLSVWGTAGGVGWFSFCVAAVIAGVLFLLIVLVFIPLGQIVSRQMNYVPRVLRGYSLNLLGGLAGVGLFFAVSRLMLTPAVWLGAVLAGFAFLQTTSRERWFVLSLLVPLALLLHEPSNRDHYSIWTPYQEIEYSRFHAPNGEFVKGILEVNHTSYQLVLNLSTDFLQRHPGLLTEPADENSYNVPFRVADKAPRVLIVGAGAGNDVAAALRNGSASIDAVEIDPAILALGQRENPEHPYDSPRVSLHVTDARAFLKRTTEHYDLVIFGLLDSHTQLSDFSNMRLDNFVYTRESFEEVRRHLAPNGIVFVKFAVNRPWLRRRIETMMEAAFGKAPLVFNAPSSYAFPSACFVVSPGNRVEEALATDPSLALFVRRNQAPPDKRPIAITTDDWPYLYHEGRWIPRTYYTVGLLVILIALGLYWQTRSTGTHLPSLFFFSMGAGFILLETQVISRLALFFGTVWQVNGIVIAALLIALLIANIVVERKRKPLSAGWALGGLLTALLFAYWFPFSAIKLSPALVGSIGVIVFSVPVVFAGILFSSIFRSAESPSAALGANMLGAVAGGLLENVSLILGMRALLLVAIAVYCFAGVGLWTRQRSSSCGKTIDFSPAADSKS